MIDFSEYKNIVKSYKESENLFNKAMKLKDKKNPTQSDYDKANLILKDQENFRNTILAKEVFDVLVKYNPNLLERRTNKMFSFKEIYGDDFSKINSGLLWNLPMYLYMTTLAYPICEKIKDVNGKIIDVEEYFSCKLGYETPIWINGKVLEYENRCGIPVNYLYNFPSEAQKEQRKLWRGMSEQEKQNWMDKKLWKEVVKKYENTSK